MLTTRQLRPVILLHLVQSLHNMMIAICVHKKIFVDADADNISPDDPIVGLASFWLSALEYLLIQLALIMFHPLMRLRFLEHDLAFFLPAACARRGRHNGVTVEPAMPNARRYDGGDTEKAQKRIKIASIKTEFHFKTLQIFWS